MPKNFPVNHHYQELDSLRGLAAVTVLLGHFSNVFLNESGPYKGIATIIRALKLTPFFWLFSGHEAVMLFFVLSGFVLSLQFLKGRPIPYGSFIVKRYFRIYVPYLGALAVALLAMTVFYSGRIEDLSDWFNRPWSQPVTLSSLLNHLVFLGDFPSEQYDPVLWSLVQELRISLLFPMIVVVLMRWDWKKNILLAATLSFFGIVSSLAWIKISGHEVDYFMTLHYIGVFILGYLIARHVNSISSWFNTARPWLRGGLFVLGLGLYNYGHLLPAKLRYFSDIPSAVGAALLVIAAICTPWFSKFLKFRAMRFLGDISYSLYLYHAIVLLSLVHLFYGRIPLSIILGLAAVLSLLAAYASYRLVELPAIRAGKSVSSRLVKAPVTSQA